MKTLTGILVAFSMLIVASSVHACGHGYGSLYMGNSYYIADMSYTIANLGDPGSSGYGSCGAIGYVGGPLDPVAIGLSSSIVDAPGQDFFFECFFWNSGQDVKRQCFYAYGTSSQSQTGNLIPGWINENTGPNWDCSNVRNFVSSTVIPEAVCQ